MTAQVVAPKLDGLTAEFASQLANGRSITDRTDEYGNPIVFAEDGRELVIMFRLEGKDLAHYVCSQTDIVHSRAVLVECYRRLTDYAFPPSVVRQITAQIDGLAAWLGWDVPR